MLLKLFCCRLKKMYLTALLCFNPIASYKGIILLLIFHDYRVP
jgi:hypothetical protein